MIDRAQQQAILHVHGPCLTIAGPGAGKTYVLVRRIAYLTESLNIPPEQILVITFTRAAALEMKKRYLQSVQPRFHGVAFGTFHSIFFSILREREHLTHQSILDPKTQQYFIKTACRRSGVDFTKAPDFLPRIVSEISYIKNTLTAMDGFEPKNTSREEFQRIFQEYESQKREFDKLDFDDMQSRLKELFLRDPEALSCYRKRFRFFLVDEAQDMNAVQYELLRMLSTPPYNLFLVGDDDQAIYSFRGARPELFLGFANDFPEAKVVSLVNNYRCDRIIVSSGLKLISSNEVRFQKDLRSASTLEGKIRYLSFKTEKEEAEGIARRILQEKKKDPEASIAVLYRTHARNDALFGALAELGLSGIGGSRRKKWYERPMADTIVRYISASVERPKREDIFAIMNKPQRYIPRRGAEEEIVDFAVWIRFQANVDTAERIRSLQKELTRIGALPTVAAIHYIVHKIGYGKYARENREYDETALEELLQLAKACPDKRVWLAKLKELREGAEEEKEQPEAQNAVYCYTFHGAKGLEFDHVYIVDANEGISPSRFAVGQREIEEERRMFYVAMTRAKHALTIATTMRFGNEELYPSRFIKEMVGEQ